jgi:hypothetical protein
MLAEQGSRQMVRLREKEEQLEARKRALGIASARFEAARNKGTNRTAAKRDLLSTLRELANQRGRTPPFTADF